MSSLKYVGRTPSNARGVIRKLDADAILTSGLSAASAQTSVDNAATLRALKTYVDNQDGAYVLKTYVNSQDALLVPITQRAAVNGVASLDASTKVPVAQLPTAAASTWKGPYTPSLNWAPGTATSPNEVSMGSLAIPYPGWLFRPLVFGFCEGRSPGGNGRCDVQARVGTAEIARGCAPNANGSTTGQPVWIHPTSDVLNQTPAGWNTGITINWYVSCPFSAGNDAALAAGVHFMSVWLVRA